MVSLLILHSWDKQPEIDCTYIPDTFTRVLGEAFVKYGLAEVGGGEKGETFCECCERLGVGLRGS